MHGQKSHTVNLKPTTKICIISTKFSQMNQWDPPPYTLRGFNEYIYATRHDSDRIIISIFPSIVCIDNN